MKKSRKSLVRPRKRAFKRQAGRCYYCRALMWLNNVEQFASRHGLSMKQARLLQCTGEHLIAHCEGGEASHDNIVAACWFCNSRRHRFVKPLSWKEFRKYVQKRMAKGRWHPAFGGHIKLA